MAQTKAKNKFSKITVFAYCSWGVGVAIYAIWSWHSYDPSEFKISITRAWAIVEQNVRKHTNDDSIPPKLRADLNDVKELLSAHSDYFDADYKRRMRSKSLLVLTSAFVLSLAWRFLAELSKNETTNQQGGPA